MKVFQDYAKYYNLLYQDKEYAKEATFLIELLKKYDVKPGAKIWELGTGTAKHAYYLAEQGYEIIGVEQSEVMLEIAGDYLANKPFAKNIELHKGDIRDWQSMHRYDVAISLFHVMSYLTSLQDLKKVFANIKRQIKPNGYFIFDCWYGPAVLNLKPETRFKIMQDDELMIERVANPHLDVTNQQVTIDYTLFVREKQAELYSKYQEQHQMRFLFLSEIELICQAFDMQVVEHFEWLTKAPLSENTWGACFVVKL